MAIGYGDLKNTLEAFVLCKWERVFQIQKNSQRKGISIRYYALMCSSPH